MKTDCLISGVLILMLLTPIAATAQTAWSQKADFGGGETYDPFSFVINGKAYVGTGRALPGINQVDFWEYDPATNIWSQKADFIGSARYGARGFGIGNFGYAGTGWDPTPTNTFYKYDPALNVWTPAANFGGSARYTSVSTVVGGFGYLGLGYSPYKKDFWRYDPVLNSWAQIADYTGDARQASVAFSVGTSIFVGLGSGSQGVFQDFYKYNTLTNFWSPITPFPGAARAAAFAFEIGTDAYVGLGFDDQSSPSFDIFSDMYKYNSLTDTWIQLPDFPGGKLFGGAAFAINNKGYVGMGSDTIFNTHYSDMLWEYDPALTAIAELNQNSIAIYPTLTN